MFSFITLFWLLLHWSHPEHWRNNSLSYKLAWVTIVRFSVSFMITMFNRGGIEANSGRLRRVWECTVGPKLDDFG